MAYTLIANIGNVKLPSGPMSRQDLQKMKGLQRRAHLEYEDAATRRQPLDEGEVDTLRALEEKWRDQRTPHAGPMKFPFEAGGIDDRGQPIIKEGSVWLLREEDEAQILLAQHPTRLKVLGRNFILPPGYRPRSYNWRPSIAEMTPCSTTEEASAAATRITATMDGSLKIGQAGSFIPPESETAESQLESDDPAAAVEAMEKRAAAAQAAAAR